MSSEKTKILIFTEGTILMHKNAVGHNRSEIVKQVKDRELSVKDYLTYIPIGNSVSKLCEWKTQGADIVYLTSRRKSNEIKYIQNVLSKFGFPKGELFYRKQEEEYKDIIEKIIPQILIEDDCESIGGKDKMTITYIDKDKKNKIKSIPIKEFSGIDHLPNNIYAIM